MKYDDTSIKEWTVFVLSLKGGDYYIGYTSAPNLMIPRYLRGDDEKCSQWVRSHGGGKLHWHGSFVGTQYDAVKYVTRQVVNLCEKVGLERVRGGFLVSTDNDKHKNEVLRYQERPVSMPGPNWRPWKRS